MPRNWPGDKPVYIAGKKRWQDTNGTYSLKLGSAVVASIHYSKDSAATKLDWMVEINIFGENVLLDYRTTAEAAALLVTRKLRQILKSLEGIKHAEPASNEQGQGANAVPVERRPHPKGNRAVPSSEASHPGDGHPAPRARQAARDVAGRTKEAVRPKEGLDSSGTRRSRRG